MSASLKLWCVAGVLCISSASRAAGFGDLDVVRAVDALDRGEDTRALELLKRFLEIPQQGEMRLTARFWAARAALHAGEAELALVYLEGLDKDLPEVADFVLSYRAHALRMQSRWSEALSVWRRLLDKYPESPEVVGARYSVADALFGLGHLSEAKTAYEGAIKAYRRSEREPIARYNLAVINERQGRYVDAAAGYRYIAYYRPGDPTSDLARQRFERLVRLGRASPPNTWQQLAYVDLLLTSRSLEEAEATLSALAPEIQGQALHASFEYRKAKLAYRKGDFATSLKLFGELAQTGTGHGRADAKYWLARTYSTLGRYEDAVRVYLELASEQSGRSDGTEALFKAAWLAYHGGRHEEAISLFADFLKRYPHDNAADEALWYTAWSAYRLGRLPAAIDSLHQLRQRFSKSPLVQRTYYWEGRFAALEGDLHSARLAFEQAIEMEPLDYYGVLASQRLTGLEDDVQPVAFTGGGELLASIGELPDVAEPTPKERTPEEALAAQALSRMPDRDDLPWGPKVFNWKTATAKRLVRLMQLGLPDAAADLVGDLDVLPGKSRGEVAYGRARLLYALADYNGAYRLAASAFRQHIKDLPRGSQVRYFRMAYPDAYRSLVLAAAHEFSVSPWLILSVMRQESAFDDRARSWASANGLMQIIPPTGMRIAEALGIDSYDHGLLRDPATSVRFGAWYLSQLVTKYRGNVALAIGSYNAGPEAMSAWLTRSPGRELDEFVEEIPYRETRHYVKRVLGNFAVYRVLYSGKPLELPERVPSSYLDNINF